MIRWLFSRAVIWARDRVDGLVMVTMAIELSLGIIFIYGVVEDVNGLSTRLLLFYAILAIVLTRSLALSKIRKSTRVWTLVISGIGVVGAVTAEIWRPFLIFISRLITYVHVRYSPGSLEQSRVMVDAIVQITERISLFAGEMNIWGYQFFSGAPVQLEQPRIFIWGMALFAVIAWASWFLNVRNQPFLAVVPMTAILGYLVEKDDSSTIYFGLLLAFSLVAIAMFSHLHREKSWEKSDLGYSLEMRLDIGWITGLMGILVFMTAAFLPSISVKEILDSIEEARRPVEETHSLSSGTLDEDHIQLNESSGSIGSLPSSHLISGSPNLLDTLLYQIWVEEGGEIQGTFPGKWRTHTYQEYTGQGWLEGDVSLQRFGPSDPVLAAVPPRQPKTQLTIRKTSDSEEGLLVHANQLIRVSQPSVVQWRDTPSDWQDYSSGTVKGQLYTVEVTWPAPGSDVLQVTGFDYPEWIASRYLQLPEVTPRVAALSEEFERNYDDPYSRAQAIEAYLRTFPYTLDVPLPPQNQDIVDYFLFDLQQGYCDYFATAMIVLARGAGLPARMVGGYARGEYDSKTNAYLVTGEEAHTWVEIYFNRIGWIEFEPTPSRLLVSRESEMISDHQPEMLEVEKFVLHLPEISLNTLLPVFVVVISLTLVLILNRVKYRFFQPDTLLLMIKERLYHLVEQFDIPNLQSATLNEIEEAVFKIAAVDSFSWPVRWVINQGSLVVAESASLLADAAYRGRLPGDFSRANLTRNVIRVRRVTGVLRILNLVRMSREENK